MSLKVARVSAFALVAWLCSFAAVRTADAAPPGPPVGLIASVSGSSVTLLWQRPASGGVPQSYIIEAGSSTGRTDLANFNTGNQSVTYAQGGIPAGIYYVRVRAVNAEGTSVPSNEVIVNVGGCNPPPRPSALGSFSGNSPAVYLAWSPSPGATSYVIEAGSVPGAADLYVGDTGSSTASVLVNDVPSGAYFVRILSRNACGTSAPSNEYDVIVGSGGPQSYLRITLNDSGQAAFLVTPACPAGRTRPDWFVQVTDEELYGVGFTVSSWQLNRYDRAGTYLGSKSYSRADFDAFFRTSGGRIPGGSVVQYDYTNPNASVPGGFICIDLAGQSSGSATMTVNGTDDRGNVLSYTSNTAPLVQR